MAAYRLPPLPRPGDGADGLPPNQRRLMVVAILAAHVAGVWGLVQAQQVRGVVREAAPIFVNLLAPQRRNGHGDRARVRLRSRGGRGAQDPFQTLHRERQARCRLGSHALSFGVGKVNRERRRR